MAVVDSAMNGTENESGVSELIGAILLISLVVTAVSVIGIGLLSQPSVEKIPAFNAIISTSGCNITLIHNGGDTVKNTTVAILVDGTDVTSTFTKQSSTGPWTTWGIGETLKSPSSCISIPKRVDIIYHAGSGSSIITTMNV